MAATTPRKRTTPKKVAGSTGILRLDREENVAAVQALIDDREPLFAVGDKTYTVPKKPPAAWSIKTLEFARTNGDSTAIEYALQKMLGDDGYKALAECETLTSADFREICDNVMKRVLPSAPKAS